MDWQDRCSQLVALLLTERTFAPGEFEAIDNVQWALLMQECRDAAKTDGRLEALDRARKSAEESRRAALAKIRAGESPTQTELEALRDYV